MVEHHSGGILPNDGSGPWRFGTNANRIIIVITRNKLICIIGDAIVSYLLDTTSPPQFPNIQHLVLTGHSSDGQFVQRRSVLTHSWEKQ